MSSRDALKQARVVRTHEDNASGKKFDRLQCLRSLANATPSQCGAPTDSAYPSNRPRENQNINAFGAGAQEHARRSIDGRA